MNSGNKVSPIDAKLEEFGGLFETRSKSNLNELIYESATSFSTHAIPHIFKRPKSLPQTLLVGVSADFCCHLRLVHNQSEHKLSKLRNSHQNRNNH